MLNTILNAVTHLQEQEGVNESCDKEHVKTQTTNRLNAIINHITKKLVFESTNKKKIDLHNTLKKQNKGTDAILIGILGIGVLVYIVVIITTLISIMLNPVLIGFTLLLGISFIYIANVSNNNKITEIDTMLNDRGLTKDFEQTMGSLSQFITKCKSL